MESQAKRIGQLLSQGPRNLLWLGYTIAIANWLHHAARPIHEILRRYIRYSRNREVTTRIKALERRLVHGEQRSSTDRHRVALAALSVELDEACRPLRRFQREIPLADIDQDGFLVPHYATLWPGAVAGAEPFLQRKRFDITVVDRNGSVGVRKNFRGDRTAFANELEAVLDLTARGCNVPEIFEVDFDRPSITFAYINGFVVREALAQAGAPLHDRNVKPAGFRLLDGIRERWLDRKRAAWGRGLIERVVDKETISQIELALQGIHRSGYGVGDVKYGNIIIESVTRKPYFVDFEHALPLHRFGRATATYVRDRDSAKLNRLFGTGSPTAKGLRQFLAADDSYVYAPFYVGFGVHWGAFWNPDVGIQRWRHVLADHVPIPRGGRVLDLGANNGFNALQMLRAGAAEVVAVEIDPAAIKQGLLVKRIFEWADNADYRLSYVCGSHGDVGALGLGRFDLVTAFCTLYYLSEGEMAKTISDLAAMTDTLVLQCNDEQWIERADAATFKRAALHFNVALARANGFPHISVIKRRGSRRPLVIARTRAAASTQQQRTEERVRADAAVANRDWMHGNPNLAFWARVGSLK